MLGYTGSKGKICRKTRKIVDWFLDTVSHTKKFERHFKKQPACTYLSNYVEIRNAYNTKQDRLMYKFVHGLCNRVNCMETYTFKNFPVFV